LHVLSARAACGALMLACAPLTLGAQPHDTPDSTRVQRVQQWRQRPDSSRLLYKGFDYGSDAYFSPATVLLNKGYDIFQLRNNRLSLFEFPYGSAWRYGVVDVVRNPAVIVKRAGGWDRVSRIELYPTSWNLEEWNFAVNYAIHLVGGGLTMRMTSEWYESRGVRWPRVWGALTTYAAAVMNEMTEQGNLTEPTAANVADLLFFDVAGIALFHWKQPTEFMARTLQMADWSNQAAVTFPNGQLQNNGQYWIMKAPIGLDRTRFFVRGGLGAHFGLSRRLDEEYSVTVAGGWDTSVRSVDSTGHETVAFAPGGGVYFDRNNSLLWSVTAGPADNQLAVNVYPGVLPGRAGRLGLWAVLTRENEVRLGIVHRSALGLGVGSGR